MMNKNIHLIIVLTTLTTAPLELSARTLGMVANDSPTPSVTLFDADTYVVIGTVAIPPPTGLLTGDVLCTPDLKQCFATNFDFKVFVIDPTTSPPSLAAGINPIIISNAGEDLSLSRDGKYLVVTNGAEPTPISAVNIATRTEVSTIPTGQGANSVDVCSDGSVLATDGGRLRRLTLSSTGILTDTGEVFPISGTPMNVYCAPGAQSGFVLRFNPGETTSFTIPGLPRVDSRNTTGPDAISGAFNLGGDRVFVRSAFPGKVDVFAFTPATGAWGARPLLTFDVANAPTVFGLEQGAWHPDGTRLFIPEPGEVSVYDSSTGAFLNRIMDPAIVSPTGVTVVGQAAPSDLCAGNLPPGAIVGTSGADILNGTSRNDKVFGKGGADIINGKGGNDLICGGAGSDLITGGAGDDVLDVKDGVGGNDSVNGGAGNDVCAGDPGDALSSCNP
jgi:hypothetical protein